MKASTQIKTAVKLYRDAFSDWARIVYNVPNIPAIPVVHWTPGTGWDIDGKPEVGTSADIVDRYQTLADQCFESIKDFRRGKPKSPVKGDYVK